MNPFRPHRRNKYGARRTTRDGIAFDSAHEAEIYQQLKLLERTAEIAELVLQPSWRFRINGTDLRYVGSMRPVVYRADFSYRASDGRLHVVDAKGVRTPVYRLKRALMRACHGILVEEA